VDVCIENVTIVVANFKVPQSYCAKLNHDGTTDTTRLIDRMYRTDGIEFLELPMGF
jgi:hypothetical protein